jgi:hypothetical protein
VSVQPQSFEAARVPGRHPFLTIDSTRTTLLGKVAAVALTRELD